MWRVYLRQRHCVLYVKQLSLIKNEFLDAAWDTVVNPYSVYQTFGQVDY